MMRVRCRLRELREQMPRKQDGTPVSLRDIEKLAGVSAGILSQIERGVMLPPDSQLEQLEQAYGATVDEWYDQRILPWIERDTVAA